MTKEICERLKWCAEAHLTPLVCQAILFIERFPRNAASLHETSNKVSVRDLLRQILRPHDDSDE